MNSIIKKLALCAFLGASGSALAVPVLMPNGDFSAGSTSWTSAGPITSFSYPDSGGNPGGYGVMNATNGQWGIWVGNGDAAISLSSLGLTAGQTYVFSQDMRIEGGVGTNIGGFKIDFVPFGTTGDIRISRIGDGTTWETYNYPVAIPAGTTGIKVVTLWGLNSVVGFDNFTVENGAVPPPPVIPGIPNPGFEIPGGASWAPVSGGSTTTYSYPTTGGNPGGYGVMTNTSGWGIWVSNSDAVLTLEQLSLTAGQTYNFTVDMKIFSGANIGKYKIDFAPGGSTGELTPAISGDGSSWATYTFSVLIPIGTTGLKIVPVAGAGSSVGFDNFTVENGAVPPPPVIPGIPNPGFEIPGGASWAPVSGGGTTTYSYPTTGGNPGGYGVMTNTSGWGIWVSNSESFLTVGQLSLTPGQTYNFTVDMKIFSGANIGKYRIDFAPDGSTGELTPAISGDGSSWATYTFSVLIPIGTTGLKILPVAGAGSSVGFDNVTVDTRDKVRLSVVAVNGTVTGGGDYLPGSTATLSATPAAGYLFSSWSGAGSGTSNPLSLVVNSAISVTANFTPSTVDSDGDGLDDYLEAVVYGTSTALRDSDGDGLTDAWEVGRGRFSIIAGSFTWSQARAAAQASGGELACFPSADRWNRAMETLGANALDEYNGLWIGASDAAVEGNWTWVNGEPFAFTQWATGRPSAVTGNTLDFAEVSGGGGAEIGKWYDRSPSTTRDGYILETGYATNPTVADADGDGLNDSQEQTAGSNPFLADTDGDGLTDGQEVNLTRTNPKLADSNGNGTNDAAEDSDTDGLTNLAEVTQHGTDPLDDDSDNDGLKDGAEVNYAGSFYKLVQGSFTYPQAVADAATKRGRVASFLEAANYARMAGKARQVTQAYLWIGLSDATTEGSWKWTNGSTATYSRWLAGEPSGGATENHVVIMENSSQWADTMETFVAAGYLFERVGLDPLDPDTDADGLSDGQEVNTTLSSPVLDDTDGDGLLDGAEVNTHGSSPLLTDTDEDGLNDRVEVEVYQSNPSVKDSDSDGFDDLFEVNTGFNPALATSTPDALSTIRTAVEFRFNAATGVSYRIEASTDLNQWDIIEPAIIGQSAVVTRFYSIENQPRRYFRVRRN